MATNEEEINRILEVESIGTDEDKAFKVLNIEQGSSAKDIEKTYQDLSLQVNPDNNIDNQKKAAQAFKLLEEAHTAAMSFNIQNQKNQEFKQYIEGQETAEVEGKQEEAEATRKQQEETKKPATEEIIEENAIEIRRILNVDLQPDSEDTDKAFEVLNIEKGSPLNLILAAYRKLLLKTHPDKNTDNKKVSQEQIDEACKILTHAIEIARKYAMEGNAPNEQQALINELFEVYLQNQAWPYIRLLFMDGQPQPDAQTINSILQKTIKGGLFSSRNYKIQEQMELLKFLCSLQGNNKPTQDTVSSIFKSACSEKQWDLLSFLSSMEGDNKPNRGAIDHAVKIVLDSSETQRLLEILCTLKSDNKLSQEILDEILLNKAKKAEALVQPHPSELESVLILCQSFNQPSQAAVSDALKLIACKSSTTIVKLCQMQTNNKPNQEAINYVLEQAVIKNDKNLIDILCSMKSDNQPSQEGVNNALSKGLEVSILTNNWKAVDFLCNLQKTIKPDEQLIQKARQLKEKNAKEQDVQDTANNLFKTYIADKNWDSAEQLLTPTTETRPNKETISASLKSEILTAPARFIKALCTLDQTHRANKKKVISALKELVKFKGNIDWEKVEILCTIKTHNNHVRPIDKAFRHAAKEKNWGVVKHFCEWSSIKPAKKPIEEAFSIAIEAENWEVVKYFYKLNSEIKLDKKSIEYLWNRIILRQNFELLKTMCSIEIDSKSTQERLNTALLVASRLCEWDAVEYLCNLKTQNKPSEEAVTEALKKAQESGSTIAIQPSAQEKAEVAPQQQQVEILPNQDAETQQIATKESAEVALTVALNEFNTKTLQLLNELKTTGESLNKRGRARPEYTKVAEAVNILHQKVNRETTQLKGKELNKDNWNEYYKNCRAAFLEAERTAKTHRGWHRLDSIIKGFLGVLATIAVIPAIAIALSSKDGYKKTFFSKEIPDTNTTKKLAEFKKQFEASKTEFERCEIKENGPSAKGSN